jgi:type VI protein secretion system component VasF
MSRPQAQEPKRSLLPLWAMFAVFAVPVVAAWFLYLQRT